MPDSSNLKKRIQTYYSEQRRLFAEVTGGSGYYNLGWVPERYRGTFVSAQRSLVRLVISQLQLQPRFRVLDVGCGFGQPALETALENDVEVIGLDLLHEPLEFAQHLKSKSVSGNFIRFVQGDAAVLPFTENCFNGVYSIESAFHYENKALFLRECQRVLSPEGRLAIADIVLEEKKSDFWLHAAYKRALASPALFSTKSYLLMAKKVGLTPVNTYDMTSGVTKSLALAAHPLRKSMKKLLSDGYSLGFLLLIYFSFLHLQFTYHFIPARYKLFVFKKDLTTTTLSHQDIGEADRFPRQDAAPICPYCQQTMSAMKTPPMTNWESPFLWVCFNDQCGYFQRGWEWMASQFNARSSYRHKIDPVTGEQGPLPVWSPDALKSEIIERKKEETGK